MPFSISGSGDITADVTEVIDAEEDQATADAKFETDRIAAEAAVSDVEAAIVAELKAIVAKYPSNFKTLLFTGQSQSTDLVIVVQSEAQAAAAASAPTPDAPVDSAPVDQTAAPDAAPSSVVTMPASPNA